MFFLNHFVAENSNLITEKGLYFWQALLNGSFSNLIQNEENAQVRAAACDCLGSIGLQIFEQFPVITQNCCNTYCVYNKLNCRGTSNYW